MVWECHLCQRRGGGPLYVSLGDGNTNHQPDVSPSWWGEVTGRGASGQSGTNPGIITRVAGEALASLRVVSIAANGQAVYANAQVEALVTTVIGVSLAAVNIGESVQIQTLGVVTEPGWSFTPGSSIFLGAGSLLSATPPNTGWVVKMGTALSSTEVAIQRQPTIKLT